MKNLRFLMGLMMAVMTFFLASPQLLAEDESNNRLAKGALVGAGTNVIGGAVLDSLDGSSQAQPQYVQVQGPDGKLYWQQVGPAPQDPNKVILKRAVQGAITGAVAAEVAKDDKGSHDSGGSASEDDDEGKKHKHKKSKEGWRPPGWDRGKKTGWGGGDVPPGHQENHHDDDDNNNESEGNQGWLKRLFT